MGVFSANLQHNPQSFDKVNISFQSLLKMALNIKIWIFPLLLWTLGSELTQAKPSRNREICLPETALCLRNSDCCSGECGKSPKYYYGRCKEALPVVKKNYEELLVKLILTLYQSSGKTAAALPVPVAALPHTKIPDDDDDHHDDHEDQKIFGIEEIGKIHHSDGHHGGGGRHVQKSPLDPEQLLLELHKHTHDLHNHLHNDH